MGIYLKMYSRLVFVLKLEGVTVSSSHCTKVSWLPFQGNNWLIVGHASDKTGKGITDYCGVLKYFFVRNYAEN